MDTGNTAWMLTATALVLFMTPGLAFFYGGMVRAKNVLGMLMQNFFAMGLLARALGGGRFQPGLRRRRQRRVHRQLRLRRGCKDVGPALPPDVRRVRADHPVHPVLRLPDDVRHHHAGADHRRHGRPAEVRRLRRVHRRLAGRWSTPRSPTWCSPAAGWPTWARSTSPAARSSTSTPAPRPWPLVLVIGKRKGYPDDADAAPQPAADRCSAPASCGSAGPGSTPARRSAANGVAAQALMNTFLAASAAMLGWLVVERIKDGHATTLGAASGAVAGLVAITPCAGFVGGMAPVFIGFIAGVVCYLALGIKKRVRVRRQPRRDRRPPGRRPRRLAPARASSPTPRSTRRSPTRACSSAAAATLLVDQVVASVVDARVLVRRSACVIGQGHRRRRSACGSTEDDEDDGPRPDASTPRRALPADSTHGGGPT